MKRTFIFGLIAAALGFTACSSEDDLNVNDNNQKKGMVLRATVEQPAESRATFTDNEGVWQFAFTKGDVIKVSNSEIGADKFYTFTYDGEKFVSEDAVPTSKPAKWYAYYPSNEVSLIGQSGKWEDIADMYVMNGSTFENGDVTGEDGLSITLKPKVAILKIKDLKGGLDINVMGGENMWASNYKTKTIFGSATFSFDLFYNDTKQTLLNTTEKGTHYIAVPAHKQLAIKNGDEVLKSTGENGLQAGKYYELAIIPFGQGMAEATGIGNVRWVQLWENGPKFAEYNVGVTDGKAESYGGYYTWGGTFKNQKNSWNDDHISGTSNLSCTGDNITDTATKLWGDNWRMPTQAELNALLSNCICTWTTQNGVNGFLCTGKGNYSSNSVFLPAAGYCAYGPIYAPGYDGHYWSSTHDATYSAYAYGLDFTSDGQKVNSRQRVYAYSVRPVLK